jgi:hypothetical protein
MSLRRLEGLPGVVGIVWPVAVCADVCDSSVVQPFWLALKRDVEPIYPAPNAAATAVARIVPLAADSLPITEIAERIGMSRPTVLKWRGR